jgi:hypothetical protein
MERYAADQVKVLLARPDRKDERRTAHEYSNGDASDRPPSNGGLPQRPLATSMPGVRIEGHTGL